MISKSSYTEMKEYWDYQRKIEYNKEQILDQLQHVHDDLDSNTIERMFSEIWDYQDPEDYEDPPRGWIPKNEQYQIEGELKGRRPWI